MCGLTGFLSLNAHKVNNGTYQEKKNFAKQSLYMSALRGIDSTGIATCGMTAGKSDVVYKRALQSPDFLQLNTTERILTDIDYATVFLGHTRSKTTGPVGDDEAHPFRYEHITMIHNGSVTNWRGIGADGCSIQTDSAHIAYAMAKHGAQPTLEKLIGAFCIVWYDELEDTFNIARNKERPLYFAEVPDWDGVVFGSEVGMLGHILDRNHIKMKGQFWYPKEYQILTWNAKPGSKLEYKSVPFVQRSPSPLKTSKGTTSGGQESTTSTQSKADGTQTAQNRGAFTTAITTGATSRKDIPTSKKAIEKANARLSKHKIQHGAIYNGDVVRFEAYPKNNSSGLGCLVLAMKGHLGGYACHIHNIKRSVYDKLQKGSSVLFHVVNLKKVNGAEVFIGAVYEFSQLYHLVQSEKRTVKETVKETVSKIVDVFVGDSDECGDVEHDDHGIFGVSSGGPGLYKGPGGKYFTQEEWHEISMDGCACCNGDLMIQESDQVLWVGPQENTPICGDCLKNPALLEGLGISIPMNRMS